MHPLLYVCVGPTSSLKLVPLFKLKVSRSFAAVIQQLPNQLVKDIAVFYLVLRGLDTVEDDMTAFKDAQVGHSL